MAKPELGTKRLCASCGAKYYDLNRDPIVCPKCGDVFETVMTARAAKAAKVEEKPAEEEEEEDAAAPEIVTLEEADAEAEGSEDVADIDSDDDDVPLIQKVKSKEPTDKDLEKSIRSILKVF